MAMSVLIMVFLSQLSFHTWCKYLKEIHVKKKLILTINSTETKQYVPIV